MDIASYLSELLGQTGEVNVPGLGNFKLLKINAYYNDSEGRFYPPANDVRFSSNFADDDILAEYIADKKKISLASSKYFTEKYVNNLKQEAIQKDVPLADLGWMRFSVHEIYFKSAGTSYNSPEFSGYPQIELKKLGNTSFLHQMEVLLQSAKEEVLPVPIEVEETPDEPELPVSKPYETEALLTEEPVVETERPVSNHDETEPLSVEHLPKEPVIPLSMANNADVLSAEEQIKETELPVMLHQGSFAADLPEEQMEETKLPLAQAEETTAAEAAHAEPNADTETLAVQHQETVSVELPYEPVTEQKPLEFDLEVYLRELETAAGISTPEPAKMQPETETAITAPLADKSEAMPEEVTSAHEAGVFEHEAILEPETLPFTELQLPGHVTEVPLPKHDEEPYGTGTELKSDIPGSKSLQPQSEVYTSPVVPFSAAVPQDEEDFVFDGKGYDDVDNKFKSQHSYAWLWITLVIIILLAGAGGYAWYRHQQSVLKIIRSNAAPVRFKALIKTDTFKISPADSLKNATQTAVIEDTTQKAATAPINAGAIDSTKIRYELIGVSVPSIAAANRCVVNYKTLGITDAHVLIPGPGMGRLIKVSLGTFNVRLDAIHKKRELLKTGNIREITILKINPKK